MTPPRLSLAARGMLLAGMLLAPVFAGTDATRRYDLAPGDAAQTLPRFAEQANREIMFSPAAVRGVRTNAVTGEYSARVALDQLVARTGLIATQDATTGAFAVRNGGAPDAKAPREASRGLSPAGSISPLPPAQTIAGRRPNIIFILTDDQGFGDVSANGHPVLRTPNLDRLHNEGVRFMDFHVSPSCSPTRSALHTGRHEFKDGVTHTVHERERMSLDAVTLPHVLKTAGYTTGIFGKWHLGDEDAYQPEQRGYDEVFIHGSGGIGQKYPGSSGDAPGNTYFSPVIKHNGRFERTEGYCTDVFFAEATKWIERVKGRQPFYAYIATNVPHRPLQVRDEDFARYKDKVSDPDLARYLGMLANADDNVGKLLAQLKGWGIEQETLVVFMNDNGGTSGTKFFNAGMRGGKISPFLGGTRASSFWRWPGTLQPAAVTQLAAHIDFFPTIAEIAGATIEARGRAQIEGRSLVSLLENPTAPWPARTLITHSGRWEKGAPPESGKYVNCSVRTPGYHLVCVSKQNLPQWMLFDVRNDYGEQRDLAAQHPQIVAEMQLTYEAWWKTVVPMMTNENAPIPAEAPFWTLYRKQFGRLPPETPVELRPAKPKL